MILNPFLVLMHLYIFNRGMPIQILLHLQVLLYLYLLRHKNDLSVMNMRAFKYFLEFCTCHCPTLSMPVVMVSPTCQPNWIWN